MRHPVVLVLMLLAAALVPGPVEAQPSASVGAPALQASVGYGTISGMVSDTTGRALDGALVSALGVTSAVATTDSQGRYAFGNLPPGPYLLRAHSTGFIASDRELVQVRPNGRLVRAITLRPIGSLVANSEPETLAAGLAGVSQTPVVAGRSDATDENGDHPHTPTAWRLRHAKRSVLRDASGMPVESIADAPETPSIWSPGAWFGAVAWSARTASALFTDTSLSGEVNLLTSGSFDSPQDLLSTSRLPRGVAYLSLGAPAGGGAWVVRAALTGGEVSSWILAGSYAGRAWQNHAVDFGLSYGVQSYEQANPLTVAVLADQNRNVGAIHGFDSWTVSPRLEVSYGARYARYDYLPREHLFSPQVTVSVSPMSRTHLRASVSQNMLAPGAEEFLPPSSAGLWLPPERTFAPIVGAGGFRPERVRHVEVAVEREFDETYVIGVRRFYQRSADQIVTLFGLADGADRLGHYLVASGGAVDADGWGVRLSSPFVGRLRGSFDYSRVQARWAPSPGMAMIGAAAPSAVRSEVEAFNDVTTSLEAAIPETATRVYFVYKINSAYARSDGLTDSPGFDGRFDLRVHQALPFMHAVSSEWEVLIAVRNLFREPFAGGSVYDELLVVRPPKRVIGGVLVRF